jgi:hypothetical protein
MALPSARAFAAVAAPLCRSVLRADLGVSQSEIDVAISSLARLKITADQSRAAGTSSGSISKNQSSKIYLQKWQEFVHLLEGQESKQSLREKLALEIRKQQSNKLEEASTEKETRVLEAEIIAKTKPPVYKLSHREASSYFIGKILYHSATDSLLMSYANGHLDRHDMQRTENVQLSNDAKGTHILKDQKRVLSFSLEGFIEIYDIASAALVSKVQSSVELSKMWNASLSPNEKRLACFGSEDIALLTVSSGKAVKVLKKDELLKFSGDIRKVEFIDDESLLVRIDNKNNTHSLVRYDLKTKLSQTVIIKADVAVIISDGKIYTSGAEFVIFSGSDLSVLNRMNTPALQSRKGNFIRAIPNSAFYLIASWDTTQRPFAYIADINSDITHPVSDFGGYYDKKQGDPSVFSLSDANFSNDGKTLIILSSKPVGGITKYFIDKWERE